MNREYYLNALICLLLLRVVVLGATLPDAIGLAAFAIYLSVSQYINVKRWQNDAEDLIKQINQLNDTISENKQKHEKQIEELQSVVQIVSAKVDQVKLGVSFSQGVRK
jgi:hypothetical protein